MTPSYYKNAHGIIVTYDITNRESLKIDHWMNEVEKHSRDNTPCILVGNKSDMAEDRQVSFEEGKEIADHYNILFVETSAKNNFNVDEAFNMLIQKILYQKDIS